MTFRVRRSARPWPFSLACVSDRDLAPGQRGELGVQAGLVALDGEQVMRAALGDQVLGVGALGVQSVCGDHRPGQVDAVQQGGEHRDLVRFRLHVHLSQDHAVSVIERGQQMPARTAGHARSAQCLAVHRDHPPRASSRRGALLGPGARRVIEGVSVQVLQGPPERGLARHHAGDAERIPGGLISIGGPFRDGRERPGAGQHRAQRQAQDHGQPVTHAAARPRVGDRGQHRQQPRSLSRSGPAQR